MFDFIDLGLNIIMHVALLWFVKHLPLWAEPILNVNVCANKKKIR